MPPLPSSPIIRYRPSRTVPGANRPWLIESEDDSHPLSDFCAATKDCATAGVGVRRLTTPIGPAATGMVGCALTPTVSAPSDAAPHAGQNRAASGSGAAQRAQVTTGILSYSWILHVSSVIDPSIGPARASQYVCGCSRPDHWLFAQDHGGQDSRQHAVRTRRCLHP